MKILVSLSFLLVFSLPIFAHNEANGGRDNNYENLEPENGHSRNKWDELSDSAYINF